MKAGGVATAWARQARAGGREPRLSASAQRALFAYGLIVPATALLLGLVAYPFFYAVYVSFTSRVIGNPGEWIGLANFRYLFGTSVFQATIWNTVVLVVVLAVAVAGFALWRSQVRQKACAAWAQAAGWSYRSSDPSLVDRWSGQPFDQGGRSRQEKRADGHLFLAATRSEPLGDSQA